ncbi:hypothetical protein OG216_09635 [Streptomycetaceae bacterium NBC_01309]
MAATPGGGTFVRNPALFRELAASDGVRDFLKDRADKGAMVARATVRSYGGPTWRRGVTRMGEYASMVFSETVLTPSGWRSKFGSDAPWTVQVEYGTGKIKRKRRRVRNVSLLKRRVSLVKGARSRGAPAGYHYVTTSRRTRPQKGFSPKQRVLFKSLRALRGL